MLDSSNDLVGNTVSEVSELLERLPVSKVRQKQLMVDRMLRQAGAHYTRHDKRAPASIQNWQLDPIPLIIQHTTWRNIQVGLEQRTSLLNRILDDIYGAQRLIKEGVVPAALFLKNTGYIRSAYKEPSSVERPIIIAAADLIRDNKDNFCVVSDRVQAPSGLGYTLQNRRVISQVFDSELFQNRTARLAKSFLTLKKAFISLTGNTEPNVVILTPGSMSETFYEQRLLASYLGVSLVEGRDLSVFDGYVWFNNGQDTKRIDVIIRRVDQEWCDPVELRGFTLGYTRVDRSRSSKSCAVSKSDRRWRYETPALHKYLPKISEYITGRELKLRSVNTLWGHEDTEQMLDELGSMIIKPFQRHSNAPGSQYGPALSKAQLDILRQDIKLNPENFVAQEIVSSAQAPAWQNDKIINRGFITRAFSIYDDGGYQVMDGGLTRCEVATSDGIYTNQLGATNKDTWIINAETSHEPIVGLEFSPPYAPRSNDDYRLNENIYWISRYISRSREQLNTLSMIEEGIQALALSPNQYTVLLEMLEKQTDCALQTSINNIDPSAIQINDLCELWRVSSLGSISGTIQSLIFAAESIDEQLSPRALRNIRLMQDLVAQAQSLHGETANPFQLSSITAHLLTLLESLQAELSETQDKTTRAVFNSGTELENAIQILHRLNVVSQLRSTQNISEAITVIEQTPSLDDLFVLPNNILQTKKQIMTRLTSDHRNHNSLVNSVERLNLSLINLQGEAAESLLPSYREPIIDLIRQLQDFRFNDDSQHTLATRWDLLIMNWSNTLHKTSTDIERTHCGGDMQPHLLSPMRDM